MTSESSLLPILAEEDVCHTIQSCRICGSTQLYSIINLGEQFIASLFVKGDTPDYLKQRYPLELVRCDGQGGCGLVQLRHTVSPSILYADYGYRSSINEIMRTNLAGIVREASSIVGLKSGDTVLDIGCNDGTLLNAYEVPGLDRLGFDPAVNVVRFALDSGLEVVTERFSYEAYSKVRPHQKAKIITSIAMFYDLEDPGQFVHDVASLLADDGAWVIELSYFPFMLKHNSFDTICHEHLEYYALKQIEWLLEKEGLQVYKLELNDINGGSFRLFIRRHGVAPLPSHEARKINEIRKKEAALGLDSEKPYQRFQQKVLGIRRNMASLLQKIKAAGKKVYVYGASTKGNTILQYFGIDNHLVEKAADRNPEKWGRHTLGTNIPIISEDQARSENPDYFLALPWHFFEGFKKREKTFLKRGGKFIIPLPDLKIVGIKDI